MPIFLPPKTIVAGSNISVSDTSTSATVSVANVGSPNGIASLDGGGKVPITQLPSSIMEYKGTWDASTNTPTLADGTGDAGDTYRVNVGGTQNLGSGSITFDVGDYVIYNGTIWQKSDTTDAVASVNSLTGNVVLTTANIADFTDKRYITDAQQTVLNNTSGSNSGDQNLFSTIAVAGQSNVVADSLTDTLTLAAGNNIAITTNATTDTITIASEGRETLTANRDYFVAPASGSVPSTYLGFTGWTNGSDSNNGLSQSTPFATIQKAINTVNSLDCSIYTVNIYCCKGTYNESLSIVSPNLAYVVNLIGDDAEGVGSLICHGAAILPGGGPFSGRIPTIARQATTTQLLVTWSGSTTKTFQQCGWGAGDTVFAIYPIAQTTTSTGSTAQAIVVNSTAGLNVYDNVLLAGFGHAGKAATARILAISGNTLTLADSLTSAPGSGVTVYKIRYDPYTLSAVSGNLLTATTAWPATTLAGTIPGWSIVRVSNCSINAPSGQFAVFMRNSRAYTLRGFRMIGNTPAAGVLGLTSTTALRAGYNTIENFSLTNNPFALFQADANCSITDLIGNVAGQMTIIGNAQYSAYLYLSTGTQHTGYYSIGSQFGFAIVGGSISRGNACTSIFQTRPFFSSEGSTINSLISISSCLPAQTNLNGFVNTVTYL